MKAARGRNYPFETVRRPAEFAHEEHDCTVRALANVLGAPYSKAHAYMKSEGRKTGRAFASYSAYIALGLRDFSLDGHPGSIRHKRMTVGQWLKSGQLPPRCIMRVQGHVFAVVHGVVLDNARTYSGRRVTNIFA